jgi:hypothetical protein
MEARNLLQEQGAGTAADAGFVQQVASKWSPLLEGVDNPWDRGVLAILLENQMTHMRSLNEDTLSTGVGSFTKYIFPVLRRVFPNLIANQIVSVQPMTSAVGGIFTYEYKYGSTKGNATAGNNLLEDFQKYYSSEYIDYEVKVAAADVDGAKVVWSGAVNPTERIPFKWLPVAALDANKGYSVVLNWTSGGVAKSQTDDGAGGFTGDGTPANSSIDYTTGAWEIDATGDIPDIGTPIYATYFYNSELVAGTTAPGAGVSATTFANADQVAAIPDVNIDISLSTVTAITRKLKARYSAEAVDDLRAFHGLNAETELVAGMANEISLELDREIITDLITQARFGASYDIATGPGGAFGPAAGAGGSYSELQSIRGLLTVIESMSAQIHRTSLRAPANFIVVSPQVGASLAQLSTHGDFMMVNRAIEQQVSPSYGPMNSNFGVNRLGTLMNKYAVYQDPFLGASAGTPNVLVGLKGASFLDAGYVYAPYIPLQVTPTFLDPADFTFRKGLRTRYAKKMLRPEYYGAIQVTGFPTITGV